MIFKFPPSPSPQPLPVDSNRVEGSTSNGYLQSPTVNTIPPIGSKPRQYSGNTNSALNSNNMATNNNPLPLSSSNKILPAKETSSIFVSSNNSLFNNSMISNNSYLKAPGSERENDTNLKKQLAKDGSGSNDSILENAIEKLKVKTTNGTVGSLFLTSNGLNNGVLPPSFSVPSLPGSNNSVTPLAAPFYQTSNTVESVVGE